MVRSNRSAKINVKVLVILLVVVAVIGASLFAARHVRRRLLSRMDLNAGQVAYDKKDWPTAYRHFQEYLGRNPDDLEILKKYAEARMHMRPLDAGAIGGAIAAYRRIIQLDPLDETAYEQLAKLYTYLRNFDELRYIARQRIDPNIPEDRKARLWLYRALVRLDKLDDANEVELDKFIEEFDPVTDNPDEYVQACVLKCEIILAGDSDDSDQARAERAKSALGFLDKAVTGVPKSVEARASRASFYRTTLDIPDMNDMSTEERLAAARIDLEKADKLGTQDPRIRSQLCVEWIAHDDLDKAGAELKAVENLTQEELEGHYFDVNDWTATRFGLALELAMRKGDSAQAASLATKLLFAQDEVPALLTEKRHRVRILDPAIISYVTASNGAEDPNSRLDYAARANSCLDEYLDATRGAASTKQSRLRLAFLRALVASAQGRAYVVIDILQPVLVDDVSDFRLWWLLAGAYRKTNQPSRAVSALERYLGLNPQDSQARLQLAGEHVKLRDWNRVLEHAQLAELLNPTDIAIRLLRIEAGAHTTAGQKELDTARLNELSDELTELRQEHPKLVDIRILQAIIALYLGQPDKDKAEAQAERELKQAIEECEEPLKAEMQLVRHYYRIKEMANAISTCKTACENHPEVAEPWLSLSGLHVASTDYDSGRSCLRQGLDAAEGRLEKRSLSMRLALLEVSYADRAAGIRLLSEIAEQDKQEIRARSLLLSIREVREDPATAQQLVDELRAAERESGLLWRLHQASLWLSSDEWRSQQPDIADLLQHCINSDPQWSSPVLLLAGMYEKLDDPKRVEDTWRRALARNPSATDIADRLVTLLEKQRRFSEAETILQQINASPRVVGAWNVRLALREGDFNRAMEELKIRVSNDDRDANSRIRLARLVYWQTQDKDQAYAYLKEAETITPGSMALTVARVSILRAEGQSEEAQQLLDDHVENSDVFGSYMMRAAYLANEGELERAERDYEKLTTFPEQGAKGYELLSNFYGRNERLDKAAATLEEGLNAYPANLRLKRKLMKTLFLRGQAEDRERALEILTTLQERLPQDPELTKIRVALILEERTPESLETARAKLENVVKLEPTAVDAHLMLIGVVMEQKEYETARDLAIRAVGSNPDKPDLLSARGRAELALNNAEMAAQLAQLALGEDPNNVAARGVLVAAAVRLTDSSLDKTAAELTHRTLEEDPNNAGAQNAIVALALKTGDRVLLDEARALLESTLDSNPTDEQMLRSLARVSVSLGLPQMAIPKLEAYCQTEAGGNSIVAIVTLADLYRLAGDLEEAEQWIERAEKIDPTSQTVVHARFVWLVAQKRFDELEEIGSAYISAKEQDLTTVLRAALALTALDSMTLKKEALRLYEHAVTLSPASKDARLGVASTLYQTGNAERAEKIYQELLEQYRTDIRILNDLAWILQEHYDDRYAAALGLANRGLRLAPDELHLLDTRGTILLNLPNRLADAKNDFERLVELSEPDSRQHAKALLQLGRVCVKLNDLVQAKQHLRKALEIDGKLDVFTTDERSEIAEILE